MNGAFILRHGLETIVLFEFEAIAMRDASIIKGAHHEKWTAPSVASFDGIALAYQNR